MITTNKIPSAIIFFGPDGSGKTTQADLLVHRLKKNGIQTKKLWLRSLHTLAFIISEIASYTLGLNNVYEFRARYSHKRAFREIWYVVEFISIMPLVLFRLFLPLKQGYTIVAERYVIDWIASLSFVSHNESMMDGILAKAIMKFIPKNSLLIYVDASYEAICSRGRKEDSLEFIDFQRKFYAKIAQRVAAIVIDTSDKTVEQVHTIICHYALGDHS